MSMNFRRHNFKLAYRNLQAAKARSFLTMLGIIIGVMAVVLIVGIGQGVKAQISGQLLRYGKDVFIVQPGGDSNTNVLGGLSTANSGLLTEADLKIVRNTPGVTMAVPLATSSGSATGDHTVDTPFIIATTTDFPDLLKQSMASGGFFDSGGDVQSVVLGSSVAQKLFDDNAPLGQSLTWRGEHFVVSGVFNDFHAPPYSLQANFNNAIFLPYDTVQKASGSVLGIYQIFAKSTRAATTEQTVQTVRSNLYSAHGGAHDVTVARASVANTASDQTLHLLTLLIAGGAVIALIVGGVGIMDVMLVSVTERMHEIGIRKAIGATNRQIMNQFVAEAFVLSVFGAAIGLLLAALAVGFLRLFTNLQAVLVWQVMVLAPLVAIAVGVFFGSMPALKAARKDPIDALRNE